jgi:hypothetical protein
MFLYNDYLSVIGCFETVERFNQIIIETAEKEGCMLIDLQKQISGKNKYFRDFVHFSPGGHVIVAEILANSLKNLD